MKHLPNIIFKSINHKKQRYETVGDYYQNGKKWNFRVSRMNAKYEFLVLIHELIEWFYCLLSGIKEKDISKFDKMYEEERKLGLHKIEDEPGFDIRAPYRKQHIFADKIERLIAKELNINWKMYSKIVSNL